MKLPLFYIPFTKYKYFLEIKKQYRSDKYIVPIGRDCHAAHSLQVMGLREQSLPYDWIRLKPEVGLRIVKDNIAKNSKFFLKNLKKNAEGNTYAEAYPEAQFTHAKAVLDNPKLRETFEKRASRLLSIAQKEKVAYLYTMDMANLKTKEEIQQFISTIEEFKQILKKEDSLHIYLRFDEKIEMPEQCRYLMKETQNMHNINVAKYIRYKEQFGIWGNEAEYPKLYKSLNIEIKQKFPLIRIIS